MDVNVSDQQLSSENAVPSLSPMLRPFMKEISQEARKNGSDRDMTKNDKRIQVDA